MTRRHYGIRVPKPRPTYTGPARAGAWSGSAFISVIVVILIVLGVILYGRSKTITDTANTTTSAPHTTGQGSPGPTGTPEYDAFRQKQDAEAARDKKERPPGKSPRQSAQQAPP